MKFKAYDSLAHEFIYKWIRDKNYEGSELSELPFLDYFYDLKYAIVDNTLYLQGRYEDEHLYWKPLTYGNLEEAINRIDDTIPLHYFTQDEIKELDGDKYYIKGFRGEYDYVYDTQDFINMSGKKWHSKRNHISKFKSLYPDAKLIAYDNKYKQDCLKFAIDWVKDREIDEEDLVNSLLEKEYKLLKGMLLSVGDENSKIKVAILVNHDEIIGLTVAEVLPSNVAIVMFEKANTDYEGSYTYLANTFAKEFLQDTRYLNRQEDMEVEGLRKSKLSYNPDHFVERYSVIKKENAEILDKLFARDIKDIKDGYIQLDEDDYEDVWNFLIDGIESLEDKKFFMNYKPDELLFILQHGFMYAHVIDGKIVATCGVDSDREYGDYLKEICSGGEDEGQYFEFSGIMVDESHRHLGLGQDICSRVISWAKDNVSPCTLCAVVQWNNIASLNNLKKLGFRERAEKEMGEYLFKYLTLKI